MKTRLDRLLVERGLAESRQNAQALIMAGQVTVAGRRAEKAGQLVEDTAAVDRLAKLPYVSRGGYKLAAALDGFGIRVEGRVCLDVGASTGGFTDVLLQRGAARVYALDVGSGQLDWKLRNDPRVITRERLNARDLKPGDIGEPVDLLVCDVSFISLTLVLPPALALLQPEGEFVALVKPQFEVGKGQVGKGGVVRSPELHREVCERMRVFAHRLGFETRLAESPILGAEGNREFLLYGRH